MKYIFKEVRKNLRVNEYSLQEGQVGLLVDRLLEGYHLDLGLVLRAEKYLCSPAFSRSQFPVTSLFTTMMS